MPLYLGKKIVGNTAQVIDRVGKKVLEDEYKISPTREDITKPELEQYDTYEGPFVDALGNEYDGVDNIKVRKVGSWIDSEISADNIRKGHSILGVAGQVDELLPQEVSVKSTTSKREVIPTGGKTGITKVTVEPMVYEQKTVTPSKNDINVYASAGYDAMSRVTVSAVTSSVDSNIKPENIKKDVKILGVTGTLEQSEGEADPILEELNITPKIRTQTFTPEKGVDGYSKVSVSAVTSDIDSNIIPKNIKRGVTILGVNGDFVLENLQSKVASPSLSTQVVTYDDDKYEGLSSVIIQPVTSSIDEDIKPENIKAGVNILGVSGEYEGETYDIEPTVNVNAKTTPVVVKPSEGYDYLSQVNIAGVTASIDPNILAENIRKNITILGVTGNLESQQYYFKDSVRVTAGTNETIIKPGDGYDALLEVIVEAVNASIDPNIIPKNIKKNVSILGVTGTLEEGDKQKWFDFEGSQGVAPLGNVVMGGGSEWHTEEQLIENKDELFDDWFENKQGSISNIGAALFSIVNGYEDEVATNPWLSQTFIFFQGGNYYKDYSTFVKIPDRVCYLYPFNNEYGVDGCLLNCEDSSEEKTYSMYLLNGDEPRVVLVDGTMSEALLPEGYNNYVYIREITIPEHYAYTPKNDSSLQTHWLKDEGVNYVINEHNDKPLTIDISAWDTDNGKDEELTYHNVYDYTVTGSLSINEDNIVSGFTTNNLFQLNQNISFKQNEKFELQMKVTTGSNLNDYQEIFTISPPLLLRIYNGCWQMPYYTGSWQSSTKDSVSANTTYYTVVKYFPSQTTQDGYTYTAGYMYLEIYDENKSLLHRYSYDLSSTFLQFNNSSAFIGSQGGAECWSGSIHLNECYIKVNDKLIWDAQPISTIISTNHNINPLTRDLMFYPKSQSIGSEELTYPFEAKLIDLSTLVDGSNFIINSSSRGITSGPTSYHVDGGISRGYIRHKSGNKIGRLDITCYTSSEASYDFGGVYVGKKQWNPSRSDLQNNYNDGTGSWIYRSMGNTSVVNCSTTLEPNTEYYITFMYTKDGSGHGGEDRFVIQKISIDGIEISAGNLINYEDDGSAVEMPLYYSSFGSGSKSFTQPILSSNGTMGGSSFATTADHETNGNNPAWYAFDGNNDTYWRGGNVPGYIDFYNPKAMVVKNIRWGYFYSHPTAGNVQGSNDGSTWENIIDWTNGSSSDFDIDLSSNTTAYKYYRINVSSVNNDVIHCKQLTITGEIDATEGVYIFSPNDSFVDGENYTNATLVDVISIPEHNANFILDNSTGKFVESKTIIINVEDENAIIYTEIED